MTCEIVETLKKENFSAEKFISKVENAVNSFSFDYEKTAQVMTEMDDEKQNLAQDTIKSCIYALAHTDKIDERNEIASKVCICLNPSENPMSEVGELFLRMHPTLQQSACRLFCCYLDKMEIAEYQTEIDELKKRTGE